MHPFTLSRADDPATAVAAHAEDPHLAFIAGGTDLLGLMKDRAALPERLLDINGLPDMARIEALPDGGLRIGALARMSDVAADPEVRERFPVIAEALLFAASGQLRNMASMGGNIMQRTRCAYFRDEVDLPCNKRRPGSGCSALHGLNRNHAIFGWSDACVATHPSDVAVALAALDANVIVRGRSGARAIPFTEFHRLPGDTPERDTVLERGDLIVAIEVPARVEGRASHYLKVRDRQSYEFALVSAAVTVATGGRRIRSARAADGGRTRMNAIGQPISRVDGRLKVTGGARYTADIPVAGMAHAAIVYSAIANGRTVSLDTTAAEKAPGVLAVFTHRNMPRMNPVPWSHLRPQGQTYLPLQDDKIHYAGQPVAMVVAETLDQAAYAGTLIEIEYEVDPPVVFSPMMAREAVEPPQRMWPLSSMVGDADKAIADAAVKVEGVYSMPDRHHNAMEPHATLAVWGDDGTLTLYDSTQMVVGTRKLASLVLGVPEERIIVACEFLGGGFGGKSWSWPHTLLAALAAKVVNRPVRVQLTRAQMYSMAGHQAATVQTIALGADREGKLTGIRHDSVNPTSLFDDYVEYAALASRHLWRASGGISTSHRVVYVNRNSPVVLRAPMEAQGHFALESAMDELAYATGVDPVELRLRNDTDTDPYSGRPFSTRALRKCLTEGAALFGWDKRNPKPRSMRDGRYLIGQGVAAAIFTHWRWPGKARVTLNGGGSALVEAAAHDIGTGTYTVMAQVAADALGLTPDRVAVRLGDTRLPESHPAIGSSTAANATAAVMLAAQAARGKAVQLALTGRDAPFAGAVATDVLVADGRLTLSSRNLSISYAELLARNGLSTLVADGDYDPIEEAKGPKAIFSFSAGFAEVRVDPDLGLVRLSRFVGAYDAGRIVNPKTARSQAIGGIIWGVGQALLEQTETDPVLGRFLNRNYSGYLVPTNADIPQLEILFVGEFDEEASPLGTKGLGELTAVAVAPAIANAVYHATGKRVRELPITVEKLL